MGVWGMNLNWPWIGHVCHLGPRSLGRWLVRAGRAGTQMQRACTARVAYARRQPAPHAGMQGAAPHLEAGDGASISLIYARAGLYIPDEPRFGALRGMGVRIEDDVLITHDGCEVLSGLVPSEPAAVEELAGAAFR